MLRYLGNSANLVGNYTASVPFFQKQCAAGAVAMTQDDVDDALEFSFERYYTTSSLLGTLDACLDMTDRLKSIEVDEAACLIDFGVDAEAVLDALPLVDELRALSNFCDVDSSAAASAM